VVTLTATRSDVRVVYVDDSGNARDLAVIGWLAIDVPRWVEALEHWKAFRTELYEDEKVRIPVDYEFHAVNFIPGRGRPSLLESWNLQKHHRGAVAIRALRTIAKMPGAQVGAAYRRTDDYARSRVELYEAWLRRLNTDLASHNSYAMVIVDGDGSEHALRRAHRGLPANQRRVIDDALHQPADQSHFLQCADLLAYTAYQNIARNPGREFMRDWFRSRLPQADGPTEL
jgi:Protein of unknown function (DUF3800)